MIETVPLTPEQPALAPGPPWGEESHRRDVWPTTAQELLLRAALVADERALEAWREVRSQIDVATLDGATQALLPMLRKNLLALGVEDELLGLFKGVHRYSWARNQMLLAPMMPIVERLERAGMKTLLLKGAAFVADTRLDAGMRPMNDVDVLVPGARVEEAIEVLLECGLVPVGGVPAWYVAEYAPRFVPSHGFRDGLDRQLDLHWHVLHASCQPDADEDFWAAAEPIELLGVHTRALCPSDELLLVILHGLRWNSLPTYRWVVDAALLCSGAIGPIDYARLVEQARLRRVMVALRAGLEYMHRVLATPIPQSCLRALASARPSRLERIEFAAQITPPRRRSALQWEAVYHQQHVRRELPVGVRPTLAAHLRVARARLGIDRVADLRQLRQGGCPGPGRPDSEMAAAVGRGVEASTPAEIELGTSMDLGDPDVARSCAAYGTWRAEGQGCWIAGREACLMLAVAQPARGSLVLELSADGFLPEGIARQRLNVAVNGADVAELAIEANRNLRNEPLHVPAHAVAGRDRLELRLRAPDAVSPARMGIGDDDRRVGVYLRGLLVRQPRAYQIGATLSLGVGSGDESALLGGWGASEPSGRWTIATAAQMLLDVGQSSGPLELEFNAIPFLAPSRRSVHVEVLVDGRAVHTVSYEGEVSVASASRLVLPEGTGRGGEILLGWRIRDPRSPLSLGISDDARELGLFIRRVRIAPRS